MGSNKVRISRLERGMSQEDLARACDVTRQTIGLIEGGNYNPTLNLCLSLARVLGKTLDQLFWEEEK